MGLFSSKEPVDMSGPAAVFVRELIAKNPAVMFSKTFCPYCRMAKECFERLKAQVEIVELDKRDDGDQIQDVLGELTGARSVPRVFIGGKCIGGGSDTKQLDSEGKLESMLREAGAKLG